MPDSFTTLWTQDRCRQLKRIGDNGPLSIIFGGPHTSMPSIANVRPGDLIYPILIADSALFLLARMRVRELISPDTYFTQHLGLTLPANAASWFSHLETLKRDRPELGHRLPQSSCADRAALGEDGSEIRFDRQLPPDQLPLLHLGPTAAREQPITGIDGLRLKHNHSFQGHVRRLSPDSAALFARLF